MHIRDFKRTFIYHSPQYPGYTSWCGLWNMPDKSVMLSCTEATGPIYGRPKAPADIRKKLDWPPQGCISDKDKYERYDMTGLDFQNIHLRSIDFGLSWEKVSGDHFQTCMNGVTCEPEAALDDGTILRGVWGPYLPYNDVSYDGYIQRSNDGSCSWGEPEIISKNKAFMFWPRRIRVLRDGRVLAGGGLFRKNPKLNTRMGWFKDMTQVLFVSGDNGYSWNGPIEITPRNQQKEFAGEEFDWVELDNGDLLIVLRCETLPTFDTKDPGQDRRQTRLIKKGNSWLPTHVEMAPFPHSGHPEMLKTKEGVIFHFATSGISWSTNEGESWADIEIPELCLTQVNCGRKMKDKLVVSGTAYYPRSVQMSNGEILCVGHIGGDDAYGEVDQSIVAVRFFVEKGILKK